jgi:hypothetical protein
MLPNLIIIGAMKAGTSSLHYYLSLHPEIEMSKIKELDFFIKEKRFNKGLKWYKSHFTNQRNIRGESSPNYTKYPLFKDVAKRMYSIVPQAKLIYILRDPVERILSEYIHFHCHHGERRNINKALKDPKNAEWINNSKYYMQLEQYLKNYDMKNILILTTEELRENRTYTLKSVFKFLNVDENFTAKKFNIERHVSKEKKVLNAIGLKLSNHYLGVNLENKLLSILPNKMRKIYFLLTRNNIKVDESLDIDTMKKLKNLFYHDVYNLRKLTGMSFEKWTI